MIFKDYYKILGLDTNKVSLDEIKIAYRESAKKYHPDVNKEDAIAEERFKDIGEAYQILSKPSAKRKYDKSWNYFVGRKKKSLYISPKNENAKAKDFFNIFFKTQAEDTEDTAKEKQSKKPQRGENIETQIEASITDAYFGKEKTIKLKNLDGEARSLKIKIPEGIKDNEKIRLLGQGKRGKNGGKNGDLIINIKIKNTSKFELDGTNLRTQINISPWEAALSTKIIIPGIDDDVTVNIPKGTQSGDEIKVKGKGYKDTNGTRGNLIVKTKIVIPKQLSKEEIDLFNKLNKVSKFNPRSS